MKRIFLRTSEFKNLSVLSFYSKKHYTHRRAKRGIYGEKTKQLSCKDKDIKRLKTRNYNVSGFETDILHS